MSTSCSHEMPAIGNWNLEQPLPEAVLTLLNLCWFFLNSNKGHFYQFCINLKDNNSKSLLCTINKKCVMRTVSDQKHLTGCIRYSPWRYLHRPEQSNIVVPDKDKQGVVWCVPCLKLLMSLMVGIMADWAAPRMWVTASLTLLLPEAEAGE